DAVDAVAAPRVARRDHPRQAILGMDGVGPVAGEEIVAQLDDAIAPEGPRGAVQDLDADGAVVLDLAVRDHGALAVTLYGGAGALRDLGIRDREQCAEVAGHRAAVADDTGVEDAGGAVEIV